MNLPVVINGRISGPGELDFYGVEVPEGKELRFELTPSREVIAKGFRAELALYKVSGSWFDPNRITRLAFSDRRTGEIVPADNASPEIRVWARTHVTLRYRFGKAGRYFVVVGSLDGQSAPDYIYQLRAVPADQPSLLESPRPDWQERSFTRRLEPDRFQTLWSRTVKVSEKPAASEKGLPSSHAGPDGDGAELAFGPLDTNPQILVEKEPNGNLSETMEVPVPSIIEGKIERPGDVDTFRFQVSPGQKLAFEIAKLRPAF